MTAIQVDIEKYFYSRNIEGKRNGIDGKSLNTLWSLQKFTLTEKKISSNQLFRHFVTFTKYLPKMNESTWTSVISTLWVGLNFSWNRLVANEHFWLIFVNFTENRNLRRFFFVPEYCPEKVLFLSGYCVLHSYHGEFVQKNDVNVDL